MDDRELKRLSEGEPSVPRAHTFQVWSCGHCENAHILLLDKRGQPMAEILLAPDQITQLRAFQYAMRHGEFPKGTAHRFLPKG